MSRMYDALQLAARDRKARPEAEEDRGVEPFAIRDLEELPSLKGDLAFDKIVPQPWRPLIPFFPTLRDRGVNVEQFRSLRSHIYHARCETPLKTILISSGMPSEGKTFVSANLAMSLSRNGTNRILLIDGDLHRPTLHNLLGAPNVPGLSEYLAGTAELSTIIQCQRGPESTENASSASLRNLNFIPAGKCGDTSSELIANHHIKDLIETVSPHFDWILIDSPPVLAVTDAVELARAADAVLLIARQATTPFAVAQRAQSLFSKARILGLVLNDIKDAPRGGSYFDDYFARPEANEHTERRKGEGRQR
jgi:protein-tyrosine kinase